MTVTQTKECKFFVVAQTEINQSEHDKFLQHIGVPEWRTDQTHGIEALPEIMGRLCYKSFGVGLNPNVTRVREGNVEYLGNIMKQKHGSVFEHAVTTVIFCDVSRILTHELVRHRPGMAYSQESQRFVRLDEFGVYIPDLTDALTELYRNDTAADQGMQAISRWVADAQEEFVAAFMDVAEHAQKRLKELVKSWDMDAEGIPFHIKKQLTSAMRRFIPGGVNTNIGVTANHRSWRHLIETRTSPGAEQEIIECFGRLAEDFYGRYPSIYQDMEPWQTEGSSLCSYRFKNSKI